ncbi:7,8-didemethyl-8-hydroxy-5-deazariboflavin synthase subunit CofG [Myxacorys almedinensis]|uniref:7,8-didemethyl-8-hydroxy-5-deazariboflavin synthase n=1 Tax=Myxacorys almedinensis A TaxID=2690445 RepID=A0A8J7Z7V3_9CYAN|nr:7,8-didemethyl-8-hydroxy-5-deazariboflavin synthase subunit CofG [Myxacorys almedinensis]NDJ19643.1 7,8-didemethyl-8-hydroxy-5-deazariboflavin synthase subunit CofG [Myxacorys almedinensis A]
MTFSQIVTYSPAYTVVPTYECFNRCTYCNFRADPEHNTWLSLTAAEATLKTLRSRGVIEILVLSGEVHPHSSYRAAWFQRIFDLCDLARSLGFLPHTNAGVLSFAEMERLKAVNVSMGLMLEQVTPTLLETVHRYAPSKIPEVRSQQLAWAGELHIPFTTGLLLGIGETERDRIDTLEAIARSHDRWGHIQEVILQPYSPGHNETRGSSAFQIDAIVDMITIARKILPESICLQIPPNLIPTPELLIACLAAGARDLGGISPHDEVNPDYPHPKIAELELLLSEAGWTLTPRLPVYPQYDQWLSPGLRAVTAKFRNQTPAGVEMPKNSFTC